MKKKSLKQFSLKPFSSTVMFLKMYVFYDYSLKKYLMQELLAITDFQNIHVLDLHALI